MENTGKLAEYRKQIDQIDLEILRLLNQRANIALQVGAAKGGKNIRRPEREAEVLQNIADANKGPLASQVVRGLFESIITACRTIQEQQPKPEGK